MQQHNNLNLSHTKKKNEYVNSWLENCEKECQLLDKDKLEEMIYCFQNTKINNSSDDKITKNKDIDASKQIDIENEKIEAEKENSVLVRSIKENNLNIRDSIDNNNTINFPIIEEPVAKWYLLDCKVGETNYWKFKNVLDKRLKPQIFQHHVLLPSYFQKFDKVFKFDINKKCPKSASESDFKNFQFMKNANLKKNAIQYRYMRKNKSNKRVDVMCRMCFHKRWIPLEHFLDHMGLAHGLIEVDNNGIVSLPLPYALYRFSPGKLKCYYCKCPKCSEWIRLGEPEIQDYKSPLPSKDQEQQQKMVIGLYTNYFEHFMRCSCDTE